MSNGDLGKGGIQDPRFVITCAGDPEYSLITGSSDRQTLFLANMFSKMKHGTKLGTRAPAVRNGSSLFNDRILAVDADHIVKEGEGEGLAARARLAKQFETE
jgi:hypothetical protein